MKIAQVSPLHESVPPKLYGGTERIVSYLTEELVRQGHEVTLFASGDSVTNAMLVPVCEQSLRLADCVDPIAHHIAMLEDVAQLAAEFDLIHYHVDYLHFPFSRRCSTPNVTTLHGRLDLPDLPPLYRRFGEMPVVSISDSQRAPLSGINWQATVYHGLPPGLYRATTAPEGYLAFLGRISPEKRLDLAIEIAGRAGREIRIAAKIDRVDRSYFEQAIQPLLGQPHVTFLGEVGETEKVDFLGRAAALLFPIDWPEPFGLVMIESFACGTPVIAFRRGSVPEVVDEGVTGFLCDNVPEAVAAVHRIEELDRRRVRETFERRFDVARMAADYVKVYQRLIEWYSGDRRHHPGPRRVLHPRHLATGG